MKKKKECQTVGTAACMGEFKSTQKSQLMILIRNNLFTNNNPK